METNIIQKTSDLSIFDMHEINRVINGGPGFTPRKELIKSMRVNGFRQSQPISCTIQANGKLKIFDGHNRFAAAKFLGIPVYFIAFDKADAISPLDYSVGQKLWAIKDIATSLASTDSDCAEVVEFSASTGIPVMAAFSIFHGDIASSGNVDKLVRNRTFKIKDRDAAWKVASVTRRLAEHCDFATSRNLVYAVSKAIHASGIDIVRLNERIQKNPELLKKCRVTDEYIDMLELIYNRNMKSEKYYLKAEIEKAMKRRSAIVKAA